MPIYEYRCAACGRTSNHFFRSLSVVTEPACPECGSAQMARLISRTVQLKPEGERIAELDTSRIIGELDGADAGSFERWARRTGSELDSALGSNFRELAEKAAAGQDPVERVDPAHTLRYAVERKLSEVSGGSEDPA